MLDQRIADLLKQFELFTENAALHAEHLEQLALGMSIGLLILGILIFTMSANFILKSIRQPLKQLLDAIEVIREGSYDEIDINTNEEFGFLASSINRMSEAINKAFHKAEAALEKARIGRSRKKC